MNKNKVGEAMADAWYAKRWLDKYDEIERLIVGQFQTETPWSRSENSLRDSVTSGMVVRTNFSDEIFLRVLHNICAHVESFEAFYCERERWFNGSIPSDYNFDDYDSKIKPD